MAIRDKILRLRGLVEAESVLRIYNADRYDLDLLVIIEEEMTRIEKDKQRGKDGGEDEGP